MAAWLGALGFSLAAGMKHTGPSGKAYRSSTNQRTRTSTLKEVMLFEIFFVYRSKVITNCLEKRWVQSCNAKECVSCTIDVCDVLKKIASFTLFVALHGL